MNRTVEMAARAAGAAGEVVARKAAEILHTVGSSEDRTRNRWRVVTINKSPMEVYAAFSRLAQEGVVTPPNQSGPGPRISFKVEKAQNDLDTAMAKLDIKRSNLGLNRTATDFDVQSAEKEVQKQQLELERLDSNLNDARIIAPFDGKITKVNGKPGDNVQAFNPVISISSPAQLLVQAQINESDMPKLAVGQRALITLDAFPGQTLNGTVRDLPSSVVTQQGVVADKNTKIVVDWTRPGAEIGMLSRVQVVVQRKDDVLMIPSNAIRTVGRRRFVEYMDGNVKRSRNVEVGISTDVDTEIVSGLDEGMTVLAGT